LLHFEPPKNVDWLEIVGTKAARLILPLRVVEELDMSKYRQRDEIAKRARALLSQLWKLLESTSGGPVKIREGVTIEVPVDDGPRQRALDADKEILDQCLMLKALGKPPILMSDDVGLSIRATARGVRVVAMPEKYLRKKLPITDDTRENS
jgi:predicted ribonuclease YlaK